MWAARDPARAVLLRNHKAWLPPPLERSQGGDGGSKPPSGDMSGSGGGSQASALAHEQLIAVNAPTACQ